MRGADAPSTDVRLKFPRLAALTDEARRRPNLKVAVAYPCSPDSFAAALWARDERLIEPILVGPRDRMIRLADEAGVHLHDVDSKFTADDPATASMEAARLASTGQVGAIMKGSQHTDVLLSAVLSRDLNLRTTRRMSHAFWFDLPSYHKPIMLTDAVVNLAPTLSDKIDILANAIDLAHQMGIPAPKVALLSALETVNPALQSSLDAAALSKMGERGQFGSAVVDGPLAFDNAFSASAAATKGIHSPVAGDPDILLSHDLDVGNVLYKSLVYAARGECAGLVLGARVPLILTSRADSRLARLASCALARLSRNEEK